MAGTQRAESVGMRWIALAMFGLAACGAPCEGQRTVVEGYASADVVKPELAKCAGQTLCVQPCIDQFLLTSDDTIETCKVTIDSTGGALIEARYIDRSVCGSNDVIDGASGAVVIDDGSWDDWGGDDGSTDDGSSDDGSNEGTPPDDGGDGSSDPPPDDGGDGTGGDGSTDARAPKQALHSGTQRYIY